MREKIYIYYTTHEKKCYFFFCTWRTGPNNPTVLLIVRVMVIVIVIRVVIVIVTVIVIV